MKACPRPCHCCAGSGVAPDDRSIGRAARALRSRSGIGLRDMAKRLGVSHTYLSLLEAGLRHWTLRLRAAYSAALNTEESKHQSL